MNLYRRTLWPFLARLEPERAHELMLSALERVQSLPFGASAVNRLTGGSNARLRFEWRGICFEGPVGIAAGWDKDGRVARITEALGAGFIEVGTVTPRPQPGNPGRRVFRVKSRDALVNRLGFPSTGAERVASNLARQCPKMAPLGVNLGKNSTTPLESAADDYVSCLQALHSIGDYFVINVSSPNSPGLTLLQSPGKLDRLLGRVDEERQHLGAGRPKPLFIKLSSDLTLVELEAVAGICRRRSIDGAVAVNTSLDPALRGEEARGLEGGLSGRPIFERALDAVIALRANVDPGFFIVGVGGVFGADEALRLLHAGADGVQLYTSLVYRGPGLLGEINRNLIEAEWGPRPELN